MPARSDAPDLDQLKTPCSMRPRTRSTWRTPTSVSIRESGVAQLIEGQRVSASLFSVLGVRPILGRNFLPDDTKDAAAATVILSHRLWERLFEKDPNVIGKNLEDAEPLRVRINQGGGLERDSDVMIDQLRPIDYKRLADGPLRQLDPKELGEVDQAIREVMDLEAV